MSPGETTSVEFQQPREGPAVTPRELEVLQLLAEGLTMPKIAEELGISRATVKAHVSNAADKLGPRRQAALVATAIQLGILGPLRRRPRPGAASL